MTHSRLLAAVALATVFGSLAPARAQHEMRRPATVRGVPVPIPTAAPVATPLPVGPTHVAFGTIAKMTGPILTVILRNRRPVRVDATWAIANGYYSAPLFIGKLVVVEGRFGRDGTLFANTVTRMTKLDATTPLDR
jgi:hypothetical protein